MKLKTLLLLGSAGLLVAIGVNQLGQRSAEISAITVDQLVDPQLIKQPLQQPLPDYEKTPFDIDGEYTVEPLYEFELAAVVLSTKTYSGSGHEANLSPVDFALGWGPMAEWDHIDQLEVSQSGRWYRWRTDHWFIPRRAIETHSANMHMVPATDEIEEQLMSVDPHDSLYIRGKLVRIRSNESNWRWQSSTTRKDTGNGACELVFVEEIKRLER